MNPREKIPGLALRCTPQGKILDILQDALGQKDVFQRGKNFLGVIQEGSIPKALNFFAEIQKKGAAFNWEFFVRIGNQFKGIHFSGTVLGDDLFMIGAKDRHSLEQISKRWGANVFEAPIHDHSEESSSVDDNTYDQFTALYNEMANLQRQLSKKSVELEKLSKQKDLFLGMAAHELRHPLGVVQILSDFLLEEAVSQLSPEHVQYLNQIKTNITTMQQLVDDFLDISIIVSGKLRLEKKPTDLVNIFQKNIAFNRLAATKKQVDLILCHDDKIPNAMVDPLKIEQVLNNLISNALKFTPEGSGIEVHLRHSGENIIFEVKDQGPGIRANQLPKLFVAYEKSDFPPDKSLRGAGLGLAIAQKIVQAHEGTIQVESESDKGSTFTVNLPIKTNPALVKSDMDNSG
jgi:signal transduction histidine kinase